jgi:O-antigen ligase
MNLLSEKKNGLLSGNVAILIALICFFPGVYFQQKLLFVIPFFLLAIPYFFTRDVKFFFGLLFFSLPLSMELGVTGSLSTDFPDEFIMLFITGILILYFIINPAIFPKKVLTSELFLIVFLQLSWMIIAVLFSYNPLLSIKYFLAKIWYIVPFVLGTLIFLSTAEEQSKASRLITLSICIPIITIIFRHASYGFTFESIAHVLFPFFRNHVTYSAMLVCIFPVLIAWYYTSRGWVRSAIIALIIIFLVALFFAYSRGAWLCLLVGLVTWWAIRKKIILKIIYTALILTIIAITWLIKDDNYMKFAPDFDHTYFHTDFSSHLEATYKLKDISTMERVYRWVAGVRMIKEEPLTGFGPNTFVHYYKNYTVAAFKTWVSANEERSTVHNYFLLVTIEQGFPGLILFLLLVILMFRTSVRAYHQLNDQHDKIVAILCGVIFAMIIMLNLLSDLIETDKIGSLFYIILGLLIHLEYKMYSQRKTNEEVV